MSMMLVGSDRACFDQADGGRTEFFDIFYCLSAEQLAAPADPSGTAAAVLRRAQAFIVDDLAPLFPYWRQPVSDQVALASIAFVASFLQVNGARIGRILGDVVAETAGYDYRAPLAQLTRVFAALRQAHGGPGVARQFGALLIELLIDPSHLDTHTTTIDRLTNAAVDSVESKQTAGRSMHLTALSKIQHSPPRDD